MNSLDHRRDNRSVNQFSKNIADFTQREYLWGIALRKDFCQRGKICTMLEHGVDNLGNLIKGRLPNYNVDKIYKFIDGHKMHIEIKTVPDTCPFWTIKTSSLLACKREKAFMLIPKSQFFWLFPWETCDYFYKNFDHRIYPRFSPNDLAVRIFQLESLEKNKIIYRFQWLSQAREFIMKNYNTLFAKK
jgi:hypothetical protein